MPQERCSTGGFVRGFRNIDMRSQEYSVFSSRHRAEKYVLDSSEQMTQRLYNTGFIYKHIQSPVACENRLSTEMQR